MKITACIIAYNEEKLIGRCLESLSGAVDEIIVAHDGPCADKTLEIAEKYGAKIFVLERIGNAEPHRPFVYSQASDWILSIDADEFLSVDLKNNLRKLAEDKTADAYEFFWPYWNGKKKITKKWPYRLVMFRRDKISFLGLPQFVPIINGKIVRKNFVLEHQPVYNNYTYKAFRTKWLPWAKIQAQYYLKDFKEIKKLNYSDQDWPRLIRLRVKHPLLILFPDVFVTFFKSLYGSELKSFFKVLKIVSFHACYRAAIDFYIYFEKNKKHN